MSASQFTTESGNPEKSVWHYHPQVPVSFSPLFDWPLDIVAVFRWFAKAWFSVSQHLTFVLLAVFIWLFLTPNLQVMKEVNIDWLAQLYLRNLLIYLIVAGGLHLYFYRWKFQGDLFKYEYKQLERNHPRFTFNNQVWDNIFWSLVSGVAIWTCYEALLLWMYANGSAPLIHWHSHPVWFVLAFPVLLILVGFHFYLNHRLLHHSFFYKRFHHVHHRNINTGPWSGISMHPVEHVLFFSSFLIHLVLPTHPIHLLFHVFWQTLGAATSHAGFDAIAIKGKSRYPMGFFVHQLHHKYFECNYGNADFPCDVWFGSDHDGTEEATQRSKQRSKRIHQSRMSGPRSTAGSDRTDH